MTSVLLATAPKHGFVHLVSGWPSAAWITFLGNGVPLALGRYVAMATRSAMCPVLEAAS